MTENKDRELSNKDLEKVSGGSKGLGSARDKNPKSPFGTARDKVPDDPFGTAKGRLGDARPDKKKGGG